MSAGEGEAAKGADQSTLRCQELEHEVRALEAKVTHARGLESLLGSILDAMPDFVLKISPEGTIQFVNRVAPGLDADQVVGASFYDFISPAWRERAERAVERAVATGAMVSYESEGLGAHGETRRYFSRLAPLRRGDELEALVLIATDVTELLDAQAELRQQTEQLDLAADATGLGFWSWERDGESIHWDETTHRMFGREHVPESLDDFFQLIHPDDRNDVRARLEAALLTGVIAGTEYRVVGPDGQPRWIFAKGRVELDDDGRPSRIMGGVLDVSERRKLQEDLAQARKLEAVGQLAAGIAHNFNNMLTVILSTMELAAKRSPPQVTGLLDEGRSAALRAAKMVRQLMLFSGKGHKAQRRDEDLEAIVRRTVEMCRATFPRETAIELAPSRDVRAVRCDAAQVEHALLNVLLNARDALEGIEARPRVIRIRVVDRESTAPDEADARWACVEIADTGTGMTESVQRRALEPFFTTKGPGHGTGLGLATTYAIVKEHGGGIQIESLAGTGTKVTLSFPALDHSPKTSEVVASSAPPRGRGERILLVDDEPLIRESVSRILEDAGYRVECAASGEEALQVVKRGPSELDLVLLDQSMPGLGGRVVLRELRASVPSLSVVCFSGYASSLEGADEVLEKPVTAQKLLRTLRDVLDRRGAGNPSGRP